MQNLVLLLAMAFLQLMFLQSWVYQLRELSKRLWLEEDLSLPPVSFRVYQVPSLAPLPFDRATQSLARERATLRQKVL